MRTTLPHKVTLLYFSAVFKEKSVALHLQKFNTLSSTRKCKFSVKKHNCVFVCSLKPHIDIIFALICHFCVTSLYHEEV